MADTSITIYFNPLGPLGHFSLGWRDEGGKLNIVPDVPLCFCSLRGLRRIIKHAIWMGFSPIIYKGREVRVFERNGP